MICWNWWSSLSMIRRSFESWRVLIILLLKLWIDIVCFFKNCRRSLLLVIVFNKHLSLTIAVCGIQWACLYLRSPIIDNSNFICLEPLTLRRKVLSNLGYWTTIHFYLLLLLCSMCIRDWRIVSESIILCSEELISVPHYRLWTIVTASSNHDMLIILKWPLQWIDYCINWLTSDLLRTYISDPTVDFCDLPDTHLFDQPRLNFLNFIAYRSCLCPLIPELQWFFHWHY